MFNSKLLVITRGYHGISMVYPNVTELMAYLNHQNHQNHLQQEHLGNGGEIPVGSMLARFWEKWYSGDSADSADHIMYIEFGL